MIDSSYLDQTVLLVQAMVHACLPGQAVLVLAAHVLLKAAVSPAPAPADCAKVARELRHVLPLHVADQGRLVPRGVVAVAAQPDVVLLLHLDIDDGEPVLGVVSIAAGVVNGELGGVLEAGIETVVILMMILMILMYRDNWLEVSILLSLDLILHEIIMILIVMQMLRDLIKVYFCFDPGRT